RIMRKMRRMPMAAIPRRNPASSIAPTASLELPSPDLSPMEAMLLPWLPQIHAKRSFHCDGPGFTGGAIAETGHAFNVKPWLYLDRGGTFPCSRGVLGGGAVLNQAGSMTELRPLSHNAGLSWPHPLPTCWCVTDGRPGMENQAVGL